MAKLDEAAWAAAGIKLAPATPAPSAAPAKTFGAEDYRRIAAEEGLAPQWLDTFMGQETSGGKNIRDSVQGARGPLQITQPRFRDAGGRDFNNSEDVARTAIRELKRMVERYNGNPRAVAASWHSSPNNVNPDGTLKNPGAKDALGKTTASYQDDIARAMGAPSAPKLDEAAWAAAGIKLAPASAPPSPSVAPAFNYAPDAPAATGKLPERNAFAVANDTMINAGNAVVGLIKTIPDLVAPGGTVSSALESFIKGGRAMQSDRQKALDAQLAEKLKATEGEFAKAWTYATHAVTADPLKLVAEGAGNIAPFALMGGSLLAAGASKEVIQRVAMAVGGAMGAGEVRGNIYERIQEIPDAELQKENLEYAKLRATMTEQQAKREFGTRFVQHLPELAVAAITGVLGGRFGLEGLAAGVGPSVGRLGATAIGFADEALQGGVEQLATNVGVRRALPSQSLTEGLGVNMAAEGLAGGVGGAVVGGPGREQDPAAAPPGTQPPAAPGAAPAPIPPTAPAGGGAPVGGVNNPLPASVLVTGIPARPVPAPTEPVDLTDVSDVPGMEPGVFPTGDSVEPMEGFGVNPTTPPIEPQGGLGVTPPPIPAPSVAPPTDIGIPISPPVAPPEAPPVVPEQESSVSVPEAPPVQTDPNAVRSSPNPAPAPSVTRPVDKRRQRAEEARRLNTDRDDLLTAVAKLGGIDWNQANSTWGLDPADWKKARRPVFGMPVFRQKGGRLLDDMAEALHEAGYIEEATPNALFDAFDRHMMGQPVYTPRGYEFVAQRMSEERAAEFEEQQERGTDEAMMEAAERMAGPLDPEDEALESLTAMALLDVYRGRLGDAIIEDIYERAALETADGTEAEFDASVRRLIEEYTSNDDGQADSEAAEYPGGESAQGEGGEAGGRDEGDAEGAAGEAADAEPASKPEEAADEVADPPPPDPAPEPEAAPEPAPAPAGVVASGGGLFVLTGQTEAEARAEAVMRDRERTARRRRESAPPPEDFALAGSNRPSDVAAGQGAQNIPGLIDPEPAASPAAPSEPAESAGPDAERGRAFLREMLVEVDAVDEESGETLKARLPALEVLDDNADQLTKTKGLLECLSS